MRISVVLFILLLMQKFSFAQQSGQPVIDVHLHALSSDWLGGWNTVMWNYLQLPTPESEEHLMMQSLELMKKYNVVKAITSGSLVSKWKEKEPGIIVRCTNPSLLNQSDDYWEQVRQKYHNNEFEVFGEIGIQYTGYSPDDKLFQKFFRLAEELEIPIGIHMGLGPPGAAYECCPEYRMHLSNPLLLEEVLIRYPKLRIYVMHAGWPMLDEMVGLLYAHPQVYVDVAVINWYIPTEEFHTYLKRLVSAGFGKRIMYGSDQMIWPEAIRLSIEGIESAEFLSTEQKRDIFYNNAARFFRLSDEQIQQHHK